MKKPHFGTRLHRTMQQYKKNQHIAVVFRLRAVENEVTLRGQTIPLKCCQLLKLLMYIAHCSWKPQMDGLKNAETSSMDFYTQLVTLKGLKKQFENLWADF